MRHIVGLLPLSMKFHLRNLTRRNIVSDMNHTAWHDRCAIWGKMTSISLSADGTVKNAMAFSAAINPATITGSSPPGMIFIGDTVAAIAPINGAALAAASATTPTVGQFLDASNAEFSLNGAPSGLTPFLVNGQQLTVTSPVSGMSARVWLTSQHQVIIAYQGTTGGANIVTNPLAALAQVGADVQVYDQKIASAEKDAANLAREVVSLAAQQGIASNNVFVTGHSLGGIEAEYAAQQTGLGGIGFEATGIPKSTTAGDGANFVDVVTYGDSVGNYSSDIKGEQPFAPAYAPGQSGALPHYGQIVMVGNPADQASLTRAVSHWSNPGFFNRLEVFANVFHQAFAFHLPGVQAHDLGVTLSQTLPFTDTTGNFSAPVFSAATDTIPQFLQANAARNAALVHV